MNNNQLVRAELYRESKEVGRIENCITGATRSTRPGGHPGSRAAWLLIVMLPSLTHLLLYIRFAWQRSFTIGSVRYFLLSDDSMIAMRYAYNLAHGNGLVWNPGEYVLGVTNLGWTLVLAAVHLFDWPFHHASLVVQMLNLFVDLAIIGFLARYIWKNFGQAAGFLAGTLLAVSPTLIRNSLGGFETAMQALLVSLAFVPLVPGGRPGETAESGRLLVRAAWLTAIGTVIRLDMGIFLGLSLFFLGLVSLRDRENRRHLTIGLPALFVPVSVLVGQRLYYGDWLPNTFALKVAQDSVGVGAGLAYAAGFFFRESFYLPFLLASFLYLFKHRNDVVRSLVVFSALSLWIGYVIWIGGDAWPVGRFFAAIVGLVTALAAIYLSELGRAFRTKLTVSSVAAKIAFALVVMLLLNHLRVVVGYAATSQGPMLVDAVKVALALTETGVEKEAVIGVFFAGTTPYFMPHHRFHDLLGKCDRHIAHGPGFPGGAVGHNKWDFAYSLGQIRPQFVVTAAPYTGASDAAARQLVSSGSPLAFHPGLWIDPIFKAEYRPNRVRLTIKGAPVDTVHWVYARGNRADNGR